MSGADIRFYFDPVCPFAWMTSKWVRLVGLEREYAVEWRFISLRLVNAGVDYDAHFPPEYEAGHTAGLRLLRVAARARELYGVQAVDTLYAAFGEQIFETSSEEAGAAPGTEAFLTPILARTGLPAELSGALEDTSLDLLIQDETDEALGLTGRDVGTPIIHFRPPDGVAFFGPVISRLPAREDAVRLWEHVVGLAGFPGFAEMKRSLREIPQLPGLGVKNDEIAVQQDWRGGSRRLKK